MMTRDEIYGGSLTHEMFDAADVYVIPDYTDERVIYIFGSDLDPGPGVTVVLPDPATIRQHGWLVYLIINDTNINMTIKDAENNPLGFLYQGEAVYVGLISAVVPIGPTNGWALKKVAYATGAGTYLAEIVNAGGTDGAGTGWEKYTYSDDTWLSQPTPLPTTSGTGAEISSAGIPTANEDFRIFYGQSASFFELQTHSAIARQYGNYVHRDTGFAVILGSVIGDAMHVSNAQTGQLLKMEAYEVATNTWTDGNDFPSFQGFTDPQRTNCASSNESAGGTTDYDRSYTSPSTLDTSAMLIAYDQQSQVYFVAAYPLWPRGPYLPSMLGIADRLHFQGGSYSEASAVAYSTDSHQEYNPFLNSWQTLPVLPVIGRGLGICQLNDPLDRYFFGMGETTSVPSEVMFEYNLTTRTYTAKGTQSWGTSRESQNSAWSRAQD